MPVTGSNGLSELGKREREKGERRLVGRLVGWWFHPSLPHSRRERERERERERLACLESSWKEKEEEEKRG